MMMLKQGHSLLATTETAVKDTITAEKTVHCVFLQSMTHVSNISSRLTFAAKTRAKSRK
jgi:hypothetical protein